MASSVFTGTLTGYHIDKQSLGISQLWSNVYASQGTSVLQLAARDPTEHVYSQAKVLLSLLATDPTCSVFASVVTPPPPTHTRTPWAASGSRGSCCDA